MILSWDHGRTEARWTEKHDIVVQARARQGQRRSAQHNVGQDRCRVGQGSSSSNVGNEGIAKAGQGQRTGQSWGWIITWLGSGQG